jgi:transcriptional repressor NrdR
MAELLQFSFGKNSKILALKKSSISLRYLKSCAEDQFMECPNCGKTDNEVIDSRLTPDGIAIRRRRQCLNCSSRFTTYEATEERLVPFLINKHAGQGTLITNLRTMLPFMSETLMILSKPIKDFIGKIEQIEKAQAVKEAKKEARERSIAKRKTKSLMMTETVFKVIKRHRKGIDISKLKDKTGLDGKKIHNIVFQLRKQGKIKSPRTGFYVKT